MKWAVEFGIDPCVGSLLVDEFQSDELRLEKEGEKFFARSLEFERVDEAKAIQRRGLELATELSGLAALYFDVERSCVFHGVIHIKEGGGRTIFLTGGSTSRVRVSGNATVVCGDGTEHKPTQISKGIEAGKHSSSVRKVLRLMDSQPLDWVNLYRIWEVIEGDMGGEQEIVRQGGLNKKGVRKFKHTANSPGVIGDFARHGVQSGLPPSDPLTIKDAQGLIKDLVRRWLASK